MPTLDENEVSVHVGATADVHEETERSEELATVQGVRFPQVWREQFQNLGAYSQYG